jgi:hypothetical protein
MSARSRVAVDAVAAVVAAAARPAAGSSLNPASVFPVATAAPPYTRGSDSLSDEPEKWNKCTKIKRMLRFAALGRNINFT